MEEDDGKGMWQDEINIMGHSYNYGHEQRQVDWRQLVSGPIPYVGERDLSCQHSFELGVWVDLSLMSQLPMHVLEQWFHKHVSSTLQSGFFESMMTGYATIQGIYQFSFKKWECKGDLLLPLAVFQITFKGRVPTRNFDRSTDVSRPISSQVYHLFCQVRWPAFSGF